MWRFNLRQFLILPKGTEACHWLGASPLGCVGASVQWRVGGCLGRGLALVLFAMGIFLGVPGSRVLADVPVEFSNFALLNLLGMDRPVLDPDGRPLSDTNYVAQLYRVEGVPSLVAAPEGRSAVARFFAERPGYFLVGGIRQILGVSHGQAVQLEVRVWNSTEFGSYESAVAGGGVTGASGPFVHVYQPGVVPLPTDAIMRSFPGIRLVRNLAPPPTILSITPAEVLEGTPMVLEADVRGGRRPLSYRWQLAGGRSFDGERLVLPADGSLLRPGYHSVQLTVVDAGGVAGQPMTHFVLVKDRPAVVTGISPVGGLEGAATTFAAQVDHSGMPGAYRLTWRFADGSESRELNPTVRLPEAGVFPVEVSVTEGREVVLYHNLFSFADPPLFHAENREFGDEVAFATTNRFLERFTFLYYADLSQMGPAERESARGIVRFYRNDGPLYPGKKVSRYPQTVIYESEPFRLSPGYVLQRFDDLGLTVPDWMTWTVEWIHVPQTAGRTAGLVLSDSRARPHPGVAGTSYNDFWARIGEQAWELFHFGDFSPVADFASRSQGRDFRDAVNSEPVVFPVSVGNLPPKLVALHFPQDGVAGRGITFSAMAEDLGGLEYQWDFGDGSGGTGAVAEHVYGSPGRFEVTVSVRDRSGAVATSRDSIRIVAERLGLEWLGEPVLSVLERSEYRYEVRHAAGGVGQELALRAIQLPGWMRLEQLEGGSWWLAGRPGPAELGSHGVVLELTDGASSISQSFQVAVLNINDPPRLILPDPASASVVAGWELGPIVVTAVDPDPEEQLEFIVEAAPASVLPPGSYRLEGTGLERRLWIHPPRGSEGMATVRVTVRDLAGATDSGVYAVMVEPVPRHQFLASATQGGVVRWEPEGTEFEEGTVLRVMASARTGFELAGWEPGPAGGGEAIEWVLERDTQLRARFVDVEGPSLALVSPTDTVASLDVVTLAGSVADNDVVAGVQWWLNGESRGSVEVNQGVFRVEGVRLRSGNSSGDRENRLVVVARDLTGNATTNSLVIVWTPNALLAVGSPQETSEGRTVTFPLHLRSLVPVAGLSLRLGYDADFLGDPQFQWIGTTASGLGSVHLEGPGRLVASVAAPFDLFAAGLQPLGTVSFRVRSLPFRMRTYIEPELIEISDAMGDPIEGVDAQYGSAFIRPRQVVGDANGNRRLDIGDATLVQRMVIGLDPVRPWDLGLNDLNGNNRLDSGDVVRLLRVVAGLDAQPPGALSVAPSAQLISRRNAFTASTGVADARMEPATVTVHPGQTFRLQLKVGGLGQPIRGAAFDLAYPNRFVALQPNGVRGGNLLPAGVAPTLTNDWGRGHVRFAAATPTNWVSTEGVLAELDFVVVQAAPDDQVLPIEIRALEVSSDGYDMRSLPVNVTAVSTPEALRRPVVIHLGSTGDNGWSFDLLAPPESILVLETSSDLQHWSRRGSYRYQPGQSLLFDPSEQDLLPPAQFFRWQSFLPAAPTEGAQGPGDGR